MPFLRRRGNLASETDMRRHHQPSSEASSAQPDAASLSEPAAVDDAESMSRRQSRESSPASHRPDTPPVQEQSNKHRRFSILRFRNASDSQLSLRAKQHAETPPPVPRPPEIITTAPTDDFQGPKKKPSRISLAAKFRRSSDIPRDDDGSNRALRHRTMRQSFANDRGRPSLAALEEPESPRPSTQATTTGNGTMLANPTNRQSESSRSDASSTDPTGSGATPKTSQTGSSFFKMRRARKTPEPLFPMAHLPQKNKPPPITTSSSTSLGVTQSARPSSANSGAASRGDVEGQNSSQRSHVSPAAALLAGGGARSGHSSPTRTNLLRGRSSTMSSMGRDSTDDHLLPPTTRTSSSTGRKSFGDLFGLSRIRQNADLSRQGSITPVTPISIGSKNNSLQLARESIPLPERREEESPAKYLARLEDTISRGVIAASLSKHSDPFSAAVLRSHMRTFSFFGDPMDMAIRKLLMEAELPKETQHIDRCLQAFANRYHECNPGIYSCPDQAYFIAFSLLILHTDVFNKNNKHKMQKSDYLKNTRGEGIFDDVLECFYDNITYTPFIHVEEDGLDLNGDKVGSHKAAGSHKAKRKPLLSAAVDDQAKRAAKEPIDPYTLIIDGNLDTLRPNLKDAMRLDDHYNYTGSANGLNLKDLQKTFFRTGVLQIVSARSRPDAFMSDRTATNPDDAHPGIVDIKITKVGLLWRKDVKKRKTRSPWQEWGAILTGAQLYFFRSTGWIKSLMHQYEHHIKAGNDGIPIIFKPPLEEFKPDALMSTNGAVALEDKSYKKHKHAFVYVRQGGLDEILLADNDDERSDWIAKLNYAAAFRTSGVKMRGVVGGHYDGQGRRGIRRLEGSEATQLVQTPTGPVSIARGRIDHKMAEDIQIARRDFMQQKIAEAVQKIAASQSQLDEQLRNARHLQILAPIQPRTREQLLSAAARLSAQLKWSRMEIWKEKCHHDILAQDLEEDVPGSSATATPTKDPQPQLPRERPSSPTPLSSAGQREPRPQNRAGTEKRPQSPIDTQLANLLSLPEGVGDLDSPLDQLFQTPPQSATRSNHGSRHGSRDLSHTRPDVASVRHASVSSIPTSPVSSPKASHMARPVSSRDGDNITSSATPHRSHDDVDAEERDFLKKSGLVEAVSDGEGANNIDVSYSADGTEQGTPGDRDKADKTKIRRSLQRTLREGAGHLSHHRSKRGRESNPPGATEDNIRDSMLARGTGSFVVHGKKASVINLGTELQNMSNDEKLRSRKQARQIDQPSPPALDVEDEEDEDEDEDEGQTTLESTSAPHDSRDRRESAASASTATARSFRELHRKFSSAQAARSVSAAGRLAIPSDGESDAAVSFSEGRRSPLPPIDGDEVSQGDPGETETAEDASSHQHESEAEDDGNGDNDDDGGDSDNQEEDKDQTAQQLERLPGHAVQAVNA